MLCRLYRWLIACSVDEERSPGRWTSRHLRRCPGCKSYYRVQFNIDRKLKDGTETPGREAADQEAVGKIVGMVGRSEAHYRYLGRDKMLVPRRKRPAVAAGAVVVAAAVGLFLLTRFSPDPESEMSPALRFTPLAGLNFEAPVISGHLNELQHEYSLDKELENISKDARSAALYLKDYTGVFTFSGD